jgi:Uma2 family endonuclease
MGGPPRPPFARHMATKTLMTLQEFDALPDDGLKHELNNGELVTMTLPAPWHNWVIRRIQLLIERYLEQHPVGQVFLPDTPFILSDPARPVTLRGPDLTFLSRERFAGLDLHKRIQGAADLTIEVVSPSDRPHELLQKVGQYLAAGGRLVWIVYPDERQVRVFEASGAMRILTESDTIDAPDLLPGFSTPISRFFEIE